MHDILHRVGIKATPVEVFRALTTVDGLASWWTTTTSGDGGAGGVLQFRFGARGGFDMRVEESLAEQRVTWRVISGPDAWLDTRITWQLLHQGDYTIVLFGHRDWREQSDFTHHCSTKWAVFIMGMKALLEGGKAAPWPHDVTLDDAEAAAAA